MGIDHTEITKNRREVTISDGKEKVEIVTENVEVISVAEAELRKVEEVAAAQAQAISGRRGEEPASAQEEQLGAAERQALLSRQVTSLEPNNAVALSELFGLPDEQLVSVTVAPEAAGILETFADDAGRQMLRALNTRGGEPYGIFGEYRMNDGSVARLTALVRTVGYVLALEPGEEMPIATVFGWPAITRSSSRSASSKASTSSG